MELYDCIDVLYFKKPRLFNVNYCVNNKILD